MIEGFFSSFRFKVSFLILKVLLFIFINIALVICLIKFLVIEKYFNVLYVILRRDQPPMNLSTNRSTLGRPVGCHRAVTTRCTLLM